MSIAYSVPSIRITTHPKLLKHSSSSFSSSSANVAVIRCSNADGPLRRPTSPTSISTSIASPSKPTSSSQPAIPQATGALTLEFQRKMAKELQDYFKQKKIEEESVGPVFGFLAKNEISNGRWAMFGFAVGLLTEYATGSDFVRQLKILLSNFGIVDLD
ncbi:One-helix-protein 2 [Zostera marina]|uniref:One-helix-protein 2 n=1 Tax=Zostera marina TaxID=29655 RepID=A0A0K9PBA4_ZOSMR|nr:One-helix-protein 2 [Zostera marina]